MMLHPAYLWIGPEAELAAHTLTFLKQALCKKGNCNQCTDCVNITHNRHYLIRRLSPENFYTLAQLEVVFETLSFALHTGEQFFFIFEHAHLFNQASANSLLKSLEEPPAGYHFILLASRADGILPTIRSRCLIEHFSGSLAASANPLFNFFISPEQERAADFVKELEKSKILEREVYELVDHLLRYWHEQLKNAYATNNEALILLSQKMSDIIHDAGNYLPMSGSAKLFLKNLYLRVIA